MVVKYSKLLNVTSVVTHEPYTILVEYIDAEKFQGVSLEHLDGEYRSTEDFDKAKNRHFDVLKKGLDAARPYMKSHTKESDIKIYNAFLLSTHDARQLVEALNEALQASEEF